MGGDEAGVRVMLCGSTVGQACGWKILEAGWAVCGELGSEAVVSNAHFTNTLSGCGFLSGGTVGTTLV